MNIVITYLMFFLVITGVLLTMHSFLFFSLKYFLKMDLLNLKVMAGLILFFSVCFPLAMVLVRSSENFLTRGFYVFGAAWFGIMINLIIAVIVGWILYWPVSSLVNKVEFSSVFFVILMFFVFYSISGIWATYHPKVNQLDIIINNLPEFWKDKKVVQLSDVHLGPALGVHYLEKLVKQVNETKPDLILITGDFFDGMAGGLEKFVEPLNNLKATQSIYFVTGNHENYQNINNIIATLEKTNIKVLDNQIVDLNGLLILGASYPSFNNGNKDVPEIFKAQPEFDINKPKILMYHTPTNLKQNHNNLKEQQYSTYWMPDTDFSAVKDLKIDLQLSGHTHRGQIWPFNFITKYLFKSYDFGLNRINGLQIYTTSGTGVWGPLMRTGSDSEIVLINLH